MNPERIERLSDPSVFPETAEGGGVEVIQTHLSVVCLVGEFAYKFKKSIRLPFADFSSLEKRKHYCEEELRLNRRLCPDVYLDVVPLWRNREGRMKIGRELEGEVVDFAVRMRRLPAERMLDVLLEKNAVTVKDIESVAVRGVRFHASADRSENSIRRGDPEKLREFALENFSETRNLTKDGGVFYRPLHRALEKRTRSDFDRLLPMLRQRAQGGCVVDGHGDLHARNICLTRPVTIYDCIEFNPELRCGDVALEHAFLIMDLRFRGHPELAEAYFDFVREATGDKGMIDLIPMSIRYRAMVRAKVAAIAAGEGEMSELERENSAETGRQYLRLSAVSAIEEDGPTWLMLCGLPGSGKSSLAQALAQASGGAWPVLSSDRIRKELAGVATAETLPERFYARDFSRRTYNEIRSRATEWSGKKRARVVILDANFREREERVLTREAAERAGARLAILRVDVSEDSVIRRLDHRASDPDSESDADHAVYRKLKAAYEPPASDEADSVIAVSGEIPANEALDEMLTSLLES